VNRVVEFLGENERIQVATLIVWRNSSILIYLLQQKILLKSKGLEFETLSRFLLLRPLPAHLVQLWDADRIFEDLLRLKRARPTDANVFVKRAVAQVILAI
jgi:hypothetical protein